MRPSHQTAKRSRQGVRWQGRHQRRRATRAARITRNGIEIIFSSNIPHAYRQEYLTVIKKVWVLLGAGTIARPIEVGFDIDLAEIGLRDTFDGTIMSFRHTLGFRIVRPWYTFSVRGEEALAIRNCAPPALPPPASPARRR